MNCNVFIATFLALAFTFPAAAECPILVYPGERVQLTAWYAHEAVLTEGVGAGRVWQSIDTETIYAPSVVNAIAEGHPVAVTWWIDGGYATTCGELPAWAFSDSFDLGHLDRWSLTLGGL